jgi:hypothetical protein
MKVGDVYTEEEVKELIEMGLEERELTEEWSPGTRLFHRKGDERGIFLGREQDDGSMRISSYFHIDRRGGKKGN